MEKKLVHYSKENIFVDTEVSKRYIELTKKMEKIKKELEPLEKQLELELKETMEKLDKKEVVSGGIIAKLKASYIRNSVDTTRLKTEDIETYKKYLKQVEVASKVSISVEG